MNHETVRRGPTPHTGGPADAMEVAKAAASAWREASVRLAPVIGGHGVDVLLRRSLHLAGKTYPWLVAADQGSNNEVLASLEACLASRETVHALEASDALLSTFTELLASLIGESLTERLLAPIRALPSQVSAQERAP